MESRTGKTGTYKGGLKMELFKKYTELCEARNLKTDREKISLLYNLIAEHPYSHFHYGIKNGHEFDQYWLYTQKVPSRILLQATKYRSGHVIISLQGTRYFSLNLRNYYEFGIADEHEIFMEYFEKLF